MTHRRKESMVRYGFDRRCTNLKKTHGETNIGQHEKTRIISLALDSIPTTRLDLATGVSVSGAGESLESPDSERHEASQRGLSVSVSMIVLALGRGGESGQYTEVLDGREGKIQIHASHGGFQAARGVDLTGLFEQG